MDSIDFPSIRSGFPKITFPRLSDFYFARTFSKTENNLLLLLLLLLLLFNFSTEYAVRKVAWDWI